MTRISKIYLKEEVLIKLYSLFFEIFSHYNGQKDFIDFIDEILSPTEKIMVTKRVAIIYLLIKGVDYRDISQTLKVSVGTVVLYASKFYKRDSRLVKMITVMLKKEKFFNFFDDILADIFIQPGVRIGHWRMYWDHKKKQKTRKLIP